MGIRVFRGGVKAALDGISSSRSSTVRAREPSASQRARRGRLPVMPADAIETPNREVSDDQPPRWALARRMAAQMGERYVRLLAPAEGPAE